MPGHIFGIISFHSRHNITVILKQTTLAQRGRGIDLAVPAAVGTRIWNKIIRKKDHLKLNELLISSNM